MPTRYEEYAPERKADFDQKIIIRNTLEAFRVQLECGAVYDLDLRGKNNLKFDLSDDGINFQFVPVHTASPRIYAAERLTFVCKVGDTTDAADTNATGENRSPAVHRSTVDCLQTFNSIATLNW
jgi:hypothetical protein